MHGFTQTPDDRNKEDCKREDTGGPPGLDGEYDRKAHQA
jgi:hypothetical protein